MKTLRQFCVATILSVMLAVSVLAGHIGTTGVAAPPPPPDKLNGANYYRHYIHSDNGA